jgi:hypothetical protein
MVNKEIRADILRQLKANYYESLKCDVIIISGHCCPYCNSLNDNKFPIEEIFEDMKVQTDKCTRNKGCNCCVAFEPLRDKVGRLIQREKFDPRYMDFQ